MQSYFEKLFQILASHMSVLFKIKDSQHSHNSYIKLIAEDQSSPKRLRLYS